MTLLAEMPRDLEPVAKQTYQEIAQSATWLEPIDRGLLVAYSVAFGIYSVASIGLDRCLRDPAFANPQSEVSKAGKAYSQIVNRQTSLLFRLSDELLLNPLARSRAGVEIKELLPSDTPWAEFKMFCGANTGEPSPA
jgi:phage terminase small subunit